MGWSENNRNQWTKMGLYFCAKKKKKWGNTSLSESLSEEEDRK